MRGGLGTVTGRAQGRRTVVQGMLHVDRPRCAGLPEQIVAGPIEDRATVLDVIGGDEYRNRDTQSLEDRVGDRVEVVRAIVDGDRYGSRWERPCGQTRQSFGEGQDNVALGGEELQP